MTRSQAAALKWLADHGGDGVFAGRDHQALLAADDASAVVPLRRRP